MNWDYETNIFPQDEAEGEHVEEEQHWPEFRALGDSKRERSKERVQHCSGRIESHRHGQPCL